MRSRGALGAMLAIGLLAACGGQRSQTDQDHDGRLLLSALRAADQSGAEFSMDEMLVETGGSIPSGKQAVVHATGKGSARAGRARFSFKPANSSANYTMVFAEGQIYVSGGSGSGWVTSSAATTTPLYPAVRVTLLEEVVMLRRSLSGSSLERLDAGVAHRYTVTPRDHQLEQLQAISLTGQTEQTFLKSASAAIDFYLSARGDHLMRIGVHMSGTDPSVGIKQKIDSVADFKLTGRVTPIDIPNGAKAVPPDQILQTQ